MRQLCRLEEIPDGGSRGFEAEPGRAGLFAVRRGGRVWVYVNACPHIGIPLEMVPHRFMDRKGEAIICFTHGARFRVEDGECTSGPCAGDMLEAVPVVIEADGRVMVPHDAGA